MPAPTTGELSNRLLLVDFADQLVEGLAVRSCRPLFGAAARRVARPGRVAEGEDRTHLAAADFRRGVGIPDSVRARDDAVAPGREHHVLCAAAGVEGSRLADDRDHE